ncbi:alpha/beta fold hydrolase [Modestobacter versicolor]|uniref:Alpha/beta hydrolase n=1 Tax=Modestobacter versicolor TaxID=429133 RepID=A0A323VHI8_9ACTN|nr:alpha/beta hydrolase [Modestobacter versicolor]MBB3674937.1 pimeloyl-ACP methyl ester carboxylesterase [Modestobacter versicolor]PZA19618.1 alpha/beta hydrolase [Modestobacter versicolor]
MPTPTWFTQALAVAPEHRDVVVAGARVAYRVWGPAGAPGVVLVHGGAAHSGWWDHVGPLLTGHRVAALDLTGHGASDRRTEYDPLLWAREVAAVAAAAELERPVVVGHSMGGWVSVTVGVEHPAEVSSIVVIDSPLNDQPPDEERLRQRRRPHRVYPTVADAMGRFRTLPPQEVLLPYVREHVARGSLRAVEGGWTWAFDPDFFGTRLRLRDLLPGVAVPLTLLRCEHGLVSAGMAAEMTGLVRGPMPVVELPDAGHHPMLDQPLALVAALRTVLALGAPAR